MRRLLAFLLAAAAFAAGAQTTTPLSGEILVDGVAAPVFNRAKCQTATPRLDFLLQEKATGDFVPNTGEITLYAASADKTATDYPPCHFAAATGVTVAPLLALPIDKPATLLGFASEGTASFIAAQAGFDCTTANKTVYLCAIWMDGSATPVLKAHAKGTLVLRVVGPNAPTVTVVTPGEEALNVEIDPAASGEAAVTFVAKAVAVDSTSFPGEHRSPPTAVDGKARITGLVNGRDYYVTAYTYSADDNESPESLKYGVQPDGTPVKPQPVLDAWEYYVGLGGRDSGGCQAGGAGLAALACAAVLLRLRRRS